MDRKKIGDVFRHLGMLLGSGVPLAEALGKCEKHSYMGNDAAALCAVRDRILQGESFTGSLAPLGVPGEFLDLIEAAEKSGDLDATLLKVADLASPLDFGSDDHGNRAGSGHAAPADGEAGTGKFMAGDNDGPCPATSTSGATEAVDRIISQAVGREASDIHLVPLLDGILLRFRINGVLTDVESLDKGLLAPMVARIKHMSCLDVAEKRLPQDGRIKVKVNGQTLDIRVSVVPAALGEKVTLRLISQEKVVVNLESMRFPAGDLEKIRRMLSRPWGLILVTGPTGSGKTTTCYGMVNELAAKSLNAVTIEDPVEYLIAGTTQIQVRPALGLTFKSATLAALRSDPDVIFIGEIRDAEILDLALRAAQTGHLVIAQMHCRDLIELIEMVANLDGIDKAVLANTLGGMISQNLLRKLCHCKKEVSLTHDDPAARLHEWGWRPPEKVFVSVGCPDCLESGYRGRVPVNQIFEADHSFKAALARGSFERTGDRGGSGGAAALIGESLVSRALNLVREGVTSIDEVRRVFGIM